jgi:hypothetical protein
MGQGVKADRTFQRYAALSGITGVRAFAIGRGRITVVFNDGSTYRYDAIRPGARHVANMVRLARTGRGLATYINQHVRGNYAERLDR